MRRYFASVAALTTLCVLAVAATAAASNEFYGDSPFAVESSTSETQTFQLTGSQWVECGKFAVTDGAPSTGSPNLSLPIKSYEKCFYSHPSVGEFATATTSGCEWLLLGRYFNETSHNFWNGELGLECTILFKTAHCQVKILKGSPISEVIWQNVNTVSGSYASKLYFGLFGMHYEITGTGCGSSGTSGEYLGSIPISHVIMK